MNTITKMKKGLSKGKANEVLRMMKIDNDNNNALNKLTADEEQGEEIDDIAKNRPRNVQREVYSYH